jgi:hypothetical protein
MPKPKGTPGGNRFAVQTAEFLAHQKPRPADLPEGVELATKTLGVKLPVHIDAAVRSLPNRSEWLRRVITEAVERELLNQESKTSIDRFRTTQTVSR